MPATAPISPSVNFNSVLTGYIASTALRQMARGDDQVERANDAIELRFEALVDAAPDSLPAALAKLRAIIDEYDGADVPSDLLEAAYEGLARFA